MTAVTQGSRSGGGSTGSGAERPGPARRRAHGAFFAVIGVVGEVMITAGVLLAGFVVWQLWWTDVEGDRAQAQIVAGLDWVRAAPADPADPAEPAAPAFAVPASGEPPVPAEPGHAETFATLVVPRWTGEPERPISQGVDRATVLDPLGLGHYEGTAMPGAVGNFAVAGHRTTYGKPLNRIEELVAGDPLVVRTADTWYVYRVTSTRIVTPRDVEVVAANPVDPQAPATDRAITLTTCHPMFSARERYVVHGVLDYWAPATGPAPAELTASTASPVTTGSA